MFNFEGINNFISEFLDVSHNPVFFSLKELLKCDFEAFEYLEQNFSKHQSAISDIIQNKMRSLFSNTKEININYIPYSKLRHYNHKNANPSYLGKLFYLRGTIIGISDNYTIRLFHYICKQKDCPMKNTDQFETERRRMCRHCGKKLFNEKILRECFTELVIMDEHNNQVVCRTKNMENPSLNLVGERNVILGKKVEMTVVPYEKPIANKCIFQVDIVGYRQSNFSELTPSRREEALSIIKEHKDNLIDMLITEISPEHYKHDKIKKAILLSLVAPKPINICLYGDAGSGKSTLVLKYLEYLENSAFITSQTSVAGALVGVDTGGGENKLILGQLPRANNSAVLIDELNKQHTEIQDALMHIMSENKIIYSKIRSFSMDIKVSLLFCGNATSPEGRFDPDIPFYNQLNISFPFMSRCHMVIKMDSAGTLDNLNEFGEYLLKKKKAQTKYSKEQIQDVITIIRNQKEKRIPNSAYNILLDGWKKIVTGIQNTSEDDKTSILTETNRMAGNLKDLALARAMLHDGKEVTDEDVYDILELFDELHLKPMVNTFGDLTKYAISGYKRDKYKSPTNDEERRNIILKTIAQKKEPTDQDEIIKECVGLTGTSTAKCGKLLTDLQKKDEITIIQGKVKAKWMKAEDIKTNIETEDMGKTYKDHNWLLNQMNLVGSITELQSNLENEIDEENFNKNLDILIKKEEITIKGDKYTKL